MTNKPTSVRLTDDSTKKLDEMSEALGMSRSGILDLGVTVIYEMYKYYKPKNTNEMIGACFSGTEVIREFRIRVLEAAVEELERGKE